ncbi:MAG TPA: hypothetical protein VMM59_05805, partial [Thermohalobaculum sp.]|nr:hypothetical protein [Thermohalobaculum sp.]
VALNLILDLGLGGLLAWEAHLGGWIAGWLLAYVFPPRGAALRILGDSGAAGHGAAQVGEADRAQRPGENRV